MTEQWDRSLHPSVLRAASWRLSSELARRHPKTLRIMELHPGGGMYDCLSLVTRGQDPRSVIDANREGSIHALDAGRSWLWEDYLTADDPKAFLQEIEHAAGLTAPTQVPPATPATLSWRAIAAVMAFDVLGVHGTDARNGLLDTSGPFPGGPREELFEAFPDAVNAQVEPVDDRGHPASRFWFVTTDGQPQVAVEPDSGRCWWTDGTTHDLPELYASHRRNLARTMAIAFEPALR